MKDNFSIQAAQYANFRPDYPLALFEYIIAVVAEKENSWDCGTGNGQVASSLAQYFKHVAATDISQQQLKNAAQKENIKYSLQPAEATNFPEQFFDLIVVAQAIHWFQFEAFYTEVARTLKTNGVFVVTGYGLLRVEKQIDNIIDNFYQTIIGPYWDKERKYLDEEYATIPFPFAELDAPKIEHTMQWSLQHLIGYLNTWSAVQHYIKDKKSNPVDLISADLQKQWGNEETKPIRFPILLRAGKISR